MLNRYIIYRRYKEKVHNFISGIHVSSDSFRILTEYVGFALNAECSNTGAASSASIAAKPRPGSKAISMRKALEGHLNYLRSKHGGDYRSFFTLLPACLPIFEEKENGLSETELEFDIVTAIECSFDHVPKTHADDWRQRDQSMWSKAALDRVQDQGLLLSAKIGHADFTKNVVDKEIDFSLSFPIWLLFGEIKGARHVLVCIKDVYKSFESAANHKGPRSFCFKTAMVWLKEKKYKEYEPTYEELFIDTIKTMIKCYEAQHLRHFLIPKINLLQDVEENDRSETIKRLTSILEEPVKYLNLCKSKRMEFSWAFAKFAQALTKTDNDYIREYIEHPVLGTVITLILHPENYQDHDVTREKPLEKALTEVDLRLFWASVFKSKSNASDAKEKLIAALKDKLAQHGVKKVLGAINQEIMARDPPQEVQAIFRGVCFKIGQLLNNK